MPRALANNRGETVTVNRGQRVGPSLQPDGLLFVAHTCRAHTSFRVLALRRRTEPEGDIIHALIVLGIIHAS